MSGLGMKERIEMLEADLVGARRERAAAIILLQAAEPLLRKNGYTVAANQIKEFLSEVLA